MGSWVAKRVAGRMEDYVIWEETGQQSGAGGATGGGQEMGAAGTARAGVGTTWEAHQANPGGQQPRQVTRSRR